MDSRQCQHCPGSYIVSEWCLTLICGESGYNRNHGSPDAMPLNITATDVEKVASKLWGSAGLSGVDAVDLQVSCYDGSPTLSDFIIDQTDGIYYWNLTMWNSTLDLWSRGSSTVAVNCLSTELCLHQHIAGIISKQIYGAQFREQLPSFCSSLLD